MAYQVPTCEPDELEAGVDWTWTRVFDDFRPGDGWTLTYYLVGASAVAPIVCTTADAATFLASVLAATTGAIATGRYRYQGIVTLGSEKHVAVEGVIVVTPNFATLAAAGGNQSHAEKMVALIKTAIEALGSNNVKAYTIADRQFTFHDLKELRQMLTQYEGDVAMERNSGRLPPVQMVFGRTRRRADQWNV